MPLHRGADIINYHHAIKLGVVCKINTPDQSIFIHPSDVSISLLIYPENQAHLETTLSVKRKSFID